MAYWNNGITTLQTPTLRYSNTPVLTFMKANILVVDDTRDNLRLLNNILTEQGYQVRPVSQGKRAISAAQTKPPDLILLDIMMPEMDGYAVCKVLKADERTHDIPVIFISALDETMVMRWEMSFCKNWQD